MSVALAWGLGIAALVALVLLFAAVKILPEYQRGVVFRLGRVIGAKGPGLVLIIPVVDRLVRVSLQTVTADIPPQDVITKDNVTVRVNAVTYFNVVDPIRAIVAVENYMVATSQISQTTLRSTLGQVQLDELLINRDQINQDLQRVIDSVTDPWGVKVTLVEVKDVELPEVMRRAMARQAEAERERRGKVIHAQGEFDAAKRLGEAAAELERHPAAMQLRVLSTLTDIAAEKNSTLVFPFPIEFMTMVSAVSDRLVGAASDQGAGGEGGDRDRDQHDGDGDGDGDGEDPTHEGCLSTSPSSRPSKPDEETSKPPAERDSTPSR